jgi:hypothetical protein
MVEWVILTRCKILEFTNTLSRECTGITHTSDVNPSVQNKDDLLW